MKYLLLPILLLSAVACGEKNAKVEPNSPTQKEQPSSEADQPQGANAQNEAIKCSVDLVEENDQVETILLLSDLMYGVWKSSECVHEHGQSFSPVYSFGRPMVEDTKGIVSLNYGTSACDSMEFQKQIVRYFPTAEHKLTDFKVSKAYQDRGQEFRLLQWVVEKEDGSAECATASISYEDSDSILVSELHRDGGISNSNESTIDPEAFVSEQRYQLLNRVVEQPTE